MGATPVPSPAGPLVLDVFSDVVCPWCRIGHAHLDRALEAEPEGAVLVRHRAFQLAPDLPAEGVEAEAYLAERLGGPERVAEAHERVSAMAAEAGSPIRYDRVTRMPNTRIAHRAIALVAADDEERSRPAFAALAEAYFLDGADVGDPAVVAERLADAGLVADPAALVAALDAGEGEAQVDGDRELAVRIGIRGVPFFVADGRLGASGAQPPEALRGLLAEARAPAGG